MPDGPSTPDSRHGSWFTYPQVEDSQACACEQCSLDCVSLEPESTLLYDDSLLFCSSYDPSGFVPSDIEKTTLPDRAGSRWFSTCRSNSSWPTALEEYALYGDRGSSSLTRTGDLMGTLSSSHTLPTTGCPQKALSSHRPGPTFSPYPPILDGDLVSSPRPLIWDLPPSLGEAAPTSVAASPRLERLDTPRRTLDMPLFSRSGNSIPTITPLPQRKYMSRSQTAPFSEGVVDYGGGYRLDMIKRGVASIVNEHSIAFPRKIFAQKASFRLEIKGYGSYTAQLNVNTTGGPPTKRRFAERTVDFMESFIEECEKGGRFQPFPYKLCDLVLLRIELVSAASVQPFFGVV